jgi:DNA-directed RNA polymerase subunit RPC12/RpoP
VLSSVAILAQAAVVGILFTMAQFDHNMAKFNENFPARKPRGPRPSKTKPDPREVAHMVMINVMNIEQHTSLDDQLVCKYCGITWMVKETRFYFCTNCEKKLPMPLVDKGR